MCPRFLGPAFVVPGSSDTQNELDLGGGDTHKKIDLGSGDTQKELDLGSGAGKKSWISNGNMTTFILKKKMISFKPPNSS